MIFVKTFTRPEFFGPRFYTKMRKLEKWQMRDKTALMLRNAKNYKKNYTVCIKVYAVCVKFTQNV